MFCGKCGAENAKGAKFCKDCGQPLDFGASAGNFKMPSFNGPDSGLNTTGTAAGTQTAGAGVNQLPNAMKKIPAMVWVGIGAAVAVLIAIILVTGHVRRTIDLNKYLTIETSGYDGYGSATPSIDWRAIEAKYGSRISFRQSALKEYGKLLGYVKPVNALRDGVGVRLSENSGLSNGDTITYEWDINEDLSKYLKCNIKSKDGTYTVSGLTEVGTFDAFADVSVQFSGIAPDGMAEMSYSGSELGIYDFTIDKTGGLRNGDIVVVSIYNQDMEYYARNLGKIPKELSHTYTVSGLQEYVASYQDLTDAFVNDLKKEAEDSIYAYTASSYNKTSSLSNLEYAGYIFDSIKSTDGWYVNSYNDLYTIFKGDVSSTEGTFSPAKVYFPVRFTNILKGEDGSLSYGENNGISGSSSLDGGWYTTTKGYTNPLICYMELVESNRSDYNSECGGGFERFSEREDITKLDDISKSYKEELYADAKDRVESYISSEYSDSSVTENLALAGEILLTAKSQGNDYAQNNSYFVVYSATVSSTEDRFETTTVYYPVEYKGIVKLPGDEYMVTVSQGIIGHSYFRDSYSSTNGYVDGSEMYSAIVTANRDNYLYEVTDGLKQFE